VYVGDYQYIPNGNNTKTEDLYVNNKIDEMVEDRK
jgi:hypothetical protein